MKLSPDVLERFSAGRFEDFLDDGATQIQRSFPDRFTGFPDEDAAHDAARNVVGLSYETACSLGRRSGLLSMRIAFLRSAFGAGALDDLRLTRARELVDAQITPAVIKPNTSIGSYLTETRSWWSGAPFERRADALGEIVGAISSNDEDWETILSHLEESHLEARSGVKRDQLGAFINQAFQDATMLGMTTLKSVQLHVLVADRLGLRFFDDPLYPDLGVIYRGGDERAIHRALHASLTRGVI